MSRRLSPGELSELLGAYAADALAPWEAAQVEEHLAADRSAQVEVEEHRQTLAIMATAVAGEPAPPPALWESVAGGLSAAPPPLRLVPDTGPRRFPRPAAWLGGLAAAAAIAAIVVVGASALQSDRASVEDAAVTAMTAPGAEIVSLTEPGNDGVQATITLLPSGVGYLDTDLPALPADRTYQLWAIVGDEVVSAGVLGPDPGVAPFQVAGQVAGFAITAEEAGGVAVSANQPLAVWLRDA